MTRQTDLQGRPWALLSELKVGDTIELDGGFIDTECGASPGSKHTVTNSASPGQPPDLGFKCNAGHHSLDGQLDDKDGDTLVGVYKVE